MSRVSGKAKRNFTILALVLIPLAVVFGITAGNKGSSATPRALSSSTTQLTRTPDNSIESSQWTDARGAAWLKEHHLFSREGQTFVFKPFQRLDWDIPISMAYYDTAVTNAMRRPTSVTVIKYFGDKPLTLSFPPPQVTRTCKYFIVLYVGLDNPKGPETPTTGDLTPPTERVLYLADQTSDQELQKRCNPSPSRVRPS